MKIWSDPALAAIEAGEALSAGAVYIGCSPDVSVWSGHGPLTIGEFTFSGIGDAGLIRASAGQIGAAAQGQSLVLSGVDSATLAMFDAVLLRGAPVIIWRLIFNATGSDLLDSKIFSRGAVDQVTIEQTPGGTATITVTVEGAGRASGRRGGRMRSHSDQLAIDAADEGLSQVSYAGQKTLYWGGRRPVNAAAALPNISAVPDYAVPIE